MNKMCELCIYWNEDDISLSGRYGNVGQCIYFMELLKLDKFNVAPFWIINQSKQLVGWEGKSCKAFKGK